MRVLQDQELLRGGRGGDLNAVEELLNRHAPATRAVLHLQRKWTGMIDLDDIMQVTWLEAFLDFRHFDGPATAFPGWLQCIARNNLRDVIAFLSAGKRPPPDRRCSGDDALERLCRLSPDAAPSAHAHQVETREMLEAEIAGLPPDYAEVIRLVHFHNVPMRAVAARLDRTPGAAYLLWRRAVDRLATRLTPRASTYLGYRAS